MAVQKSAANMGAAPVAGAASVIIFASIGFAEPVGIDTSPASSARNDYSALVGPANDGSVMPSETVSMALMASNQQAGNLGLYNTNGHVEVPVNGGEVSLGAVQTSIGQVDIMGSWTEVNGPGDQVRRVQAIWRTADGQTPLLPFNTQVGGQQAQFLSWKLGLEEMIEWRPAITDIELLGATFFGSFDGGGSFATQVNILQLFQSGLSQWSLDGAFDVGTELVSDSAGPNGFNYIMTEYTFVAVPTPASLTFLAGAGMAIAARRRR